MACIAQPVETPASDLAAFLVERHYKDIGCDGWDKRRVQALCAKFGDTPTVMAARMRLRPAEMRERMRADRWTRQDGLILTILEREVDFLKGGVAPESLV